MRITPGSHNSPPPHLPTSCPSTGRDAAGADLASGPLLPYRGLVWGLKGELLGKHHPKGWIPAWPQRTRWVPGVQDTSQQIGQSSIKCPKEDKLAAAVPRIITAHI